MIGIFAAMMVQGCDTKLEGEKHYLFSPVDGPTELRNGNAIVGVVWTDEGTEWLYMFNNTAPHNQGSEPGAYIAPYSNRLVPFVPSSNSGLEYHAVKPFTNSNNSQCKLVDCFDSHTHFIATFQGRIKARVGNDPQLSVSKAVGIKAPLAKFTLNDCLSNISAQNGANPHVDELRIDTVNPYSVGWQYAWTEGMGSNLKTKVYMVNLQDHQTATDKFHYDVSLPGDTPGSPSGSFDEWCTVVAQKCNTPTCTARLVTWTYPS